MSRYGFASIAAAFAVIFFLLLPSRVSVPASETFLDDAGQYHQAAVHIAQHGFYSLDGVTPYIEREPGQSMLLAVIYVVFGVGNRVAIFLVQAILLVIAVYFFGKELQHKLSRSVVLLTQGLILIFPATYHIVFSPYRESLTLTLFLCVALFLLRFIRLRTWWPAVFAGLFFGMLILTFVPFLFLPVFLIPFLLYLRVPPQKLAAIAIIPYLFVAAWGTRNYVATGQACPTGCARSAVAWYVRGEQAEKVTGLEPLRCLFAEYVSRNWDGRSTACSFNGLMHQRWPNGVDNSPATIQAGVEGKQKIKQHFGNYLWFSVFEVVELHIPFVNGWGRTYNVLAALASLILYIGCLASLPILKKRPKDFLLVLAIIAYSIAVFCLLDATPRYLMPVIFCYAVLAGVGYDALIRWTLSHGSILRRHTGIQ